MEFEARLFKKVGKNDGIDSFTLVCQGEGEGEAQTGFVMPGFRIYMGRIQAPSYSIGRNAYSYVYFTPQSARDIHEVVERDKPQDVVLAPLPGSVVELVARDDLYARLEKAAAKAK